MKISSDRTRVISLLVNIAATLVIVAVTWVYGNGLPAQNDDLQSRQDQAASSRAQLAPLPPAPKPHLASMQPMAPAGQNLPSRSGRQKDTGVASPAAQIAAAPAGNNGAKSAFGSGTAIQSGDPAGLISDPADSDAGTDPETSTPSGAADSSPLAPAYSQLYNSGGPGPDLTGSNPGTQPIDSASQLPAGVKGTPYCETLPNELSPLPPFSLSTGIIPKGLILAKEKGTICGTPSESGIFRFQITSSNRSGDLIRATYRLTVSENADSTDDLPLKISSSELSVGFLGSIYSFQLTATGGVLPRSWSVSGLPDGLEFDKTSGVIGGSAAIDGEFSISITVTDSTAQTAAVTLPLVIRTTPVFITTAGLSPGIIDTPYQDRLAAQGGVPPYRWEIVQGALPPGITLSAPTGSLEGIPQERSEQRIRFRVIDSTGKNDSADLELKINGSDLKVLTPAVAEGFSGEPYGFVLTAEGGSPPYSWRLSAGALPAGFSISANGAINGTTGQAGDFRFTAAVSDQSGESADKRYLLRVQESTDASETSSSSSSSSGIEPPGENPSSSSSTSGPGPGGSGGPPDDNQLPAVTQLRAVPSDRKVGLNWKNPPRSDLVRIVVVRSSDHQPQSIDDGLTVYAGTGSNVLDTGESSSALENGVTYFYSAFADYGSTGVSLAAAESTAAAAPQAIGLTGKPDPYIDSVHAFSPLDPAGCFNCSQMPRVVLGPPDGGGEYHGSSDIVSLGARLNSDNGRSAAYGGSITLKFEDNLVVNGPGADLVIFENAFRLAGTDTYFVEPAIVEVSVDGATFYRFPYDFVPHYDENGELNLFNPFNYVRGFAGVHPVYSSKLIPDPTNPQLAGGDPFDLSDIPGVELTWISYIRITATGDGWLTDADGDLVRHSNSAPFFAASGKGNSGFDLDAVSAVHY